MEKVAVECALGRMFRLLSRPSQPGDAAEYERCRAIILNEVVGDDGVVSQAAYKPNWARDRMKGASGD